MDVMHAISIVFEERERRLHEREQHLKVSQENLRLSLIKLEHHLAHVDRMYDKLRSPAYLLRYSFALLKAEFRRAFSWKR
jgi:hypothetical protein